MATSGGEREERQAWTHDMTPPLPLKGTASRRSRVSKKGNGRAGVK